MTCIIKNLLSTARNTASQYARLTSFIAEEMRVLLKKKIYYASIEL